MANEIVKQILLRFKGDSKPLEREIKNVEKMAASLQKTVQGGQGGTGPSQLSKTLDTYVKQSQKFGMTVNKDITKFQKTIQEVATKDLKVLQRQTDDLFRKSEDKLRKLRQAEQNVQQMEERGANARQIRKQQRKTARYGREFGEATEAFGASAQQFNAVAQGTPQAPNFLQRMGPLAQIFGPAALLSSAVALPKAYDELMANRLANQSYVAQQPLQRRLAAYQGDMSMALLAQRGHVAAAQSDKARAETTGQMTTGAALGLGGAAGIIGGLGAFGAINAWNPVGWGALGVAGIGAAAYGAKRYITNDTQREAEERYNQSLQNRAESDINMRLYEPFKVEAPRRAQFSQTMGYTSGNTRAMIINGLQEGMLDPEETMAFAEQLRGTTGADRAGQLAVGVGRANLRFGLTKGTAASALAAATKFGQGGGKEAEKALEDVFRRGIAGGLKDYGMREEFTKATTELLKQYSGAISPDQLAESVSALLAGGKGGIRDIEAATGAKQMEEDLFAGKGSALEDTIVTAGAINQLKKMGAPVTATTMDLMKSLTIEDIQSKSDKYKTVVGDQKADDENTATQMVDYVRQRQRSINAPYGDTTRLLGELDQRIKSGQPLTEEEAVRYSQALGSSIISGRQGAEGLRKSTPEAWRAQGLSLLRGQYGDEILPSSMKSPKDVKAITDPAIQAEEERKKNDAFFIQQKQNTEGKTQEERDKARFTPQNVRALAEAQKEANKEVRNAGETADPSQAATSAVDAMGRFSTALDALTKKINNAGAQTYGVPRK